VKNRNYGNYAGIEPECPVNGNTVFIGSGNNCLPDYHPIYWTQNSSKDCQRFVKKIMKIIKKSKSYRAGSRKHVNFEVNIESTFFTPTYFTPIFLPNIFRTKIFFTLKFFNANILTPKFCSTKFLKRQKTILTYLKKWR